MLRQDLRPCDEVGGHLIAPTIVDQAVCDGRRSLGDDVLRARYRSDRIPGVRLGGPLRLDEEERRSRLQVRCRDVGPLLEGRGFGSCLRWATGGGRGGGAGLRRGGRGSRRRGGWWG